MMSWLRNHGQRLLLALVLCGSFGTLLLTAAQPLRLNWGDPWSDLDILNAGRFFARHGFVATRFTPIIDVEPLTAESYRYVHYPPLAEIVNGAVQALGTDSLFLFRLMAIALSAVGLFLFHRFVRLIWGSRAALFATVLFAGNALWLRYADCIHGHPWHIATGFAALAAAAAWLRGGRRWLLAGVAGSIALCFFASYDYFFFLPLMAVLLPGLAGVRLFDRRSLALIGAAGAGVVLGLLIKFSLVVWALGWHGFVEDLKFQFYERATATYSYSYRHEMLSTSLMRIYRFFSPVAFVVLLVSLAAAIPAVRRRLKLPLGPIALLVAGVPFIVVLSQLSIEQYHPWLSLLPFFAVAGGVLAVRALETGSRLLRAGTAGLIAVALFWSTRDVAAMPRMFTPEADLKAAAAVTQDSPSPYIFSNIYFSPIFRHYFNRHLFPSFDADPKAIAGFWASLQAEYGIGPVYYIHFGDVANAAADCKTIFYLAAVNKHMDWMRDPWATRAAWQRYVAKQDRAMLDALRPFTDVVGSFGEITVYRLDPGRLQAAAHRDLRAQPTSLVELGSASSERYLVRGFGGPEPMEGGSRWLRPWRPRYIKLTSAGYKFLDRTPPLQTALMRINVPANRDWRLSLDVWSGVAGQKLKLSVNGHHVAATELKWAFSPEKLEITLPRSALGQGLQLITFEYDRLDEKGRGVGISRLLVEPEDRGAEQTAVLPGAHP